MKKLFFALSLLLASTSYAQNYNGCLLLAVNQAQRVQFSQGQQVPGFQTGCLVQEIDNQTLYYWNGGAYQAIASTAGVGGVSSLNSLSGAVNLVAGSGISVTPSGQNITIAATGGGGSVTAVTASSPLFSSGGTAPNITEQVANTSQNGYLSSVDWNTFNGKQAAGSYITALTGDVAASGPGSAAATIQPLSVTNAKIANSTIDLTSKVTNLLPRANIASLQVNFNLFVDGSRTDSYTADGSTQRPFKTIGAAVTQIITNGDDCTAGHAYTVNIVPHAYVETITLNSSTLCNLTFSNSTSVTGTFQNTSVTGVTSTSNNTQLASLVFNGITFGTGGAILTGDTNGTNFASSQVLFADCQFNGANIQLTNINNVNFYGGQIQGSTAMTWQNVAFAYYSGAEGFISGTTLHLVQNNSANQPSQSSGNYFLMSTSKFFGTMTIDSGSELDSLQSYFGSGASITNNGTIHSWGSSWGNTSPLVLNSGSSYRNRGDFFETPPTGTGTVTNQYSLLYTPATSSNWNTTPTTAFGAIDTLATSGIVKSQTQNLVLASPNGSSGVPSFRALVAGDIPSLSGSYANLTLSNLSSPTSVNQTLLPSTTNTFNIGSAPADWSQGFFGTLNAVTSGSVIGTVSSDASNLYVKTPNAAAATKNIQLITGTDSGTSSSGFIQFITGDVTSGNSGSYSFQTGAATTGTSGAFSVSTGGSSGTGSTGNVSISTGSNGSSGPSGQMSFITGDASSNTSGDINFIGGVFGGGGTQGRAIFQDMHLGTQISNTTATVTVQSHAGTGSSCTLNSGTDTAGRITIVTGTVGISAGSYCQLNFGAAYATTPTCVISAGNSSAALTVGPYVTSSANNMTLNFAVAGGISTTYQVNYYCMETP